MKELLLYRLILDGDLGECVKGIVAEEVAPEEKVGMLRGLGWVTNMIAAFGRMHTPTD